MKFETKYNIGDKVWMLLLDTPMEFIITGVEYANHGTFVGCYYYIKSIDYGYEVKIPEELLSTTKEELLKYFKLWNLHLSLN